MTRRYEDERNVSRAAPTLPLFFLPYIAIDLAADHHDVRMTVTTRIPYYSVLCSVSMIGFRILFFSVLLV